MKNLNVILILLLSSIIFPALASQDHHGHGKNRFMHFFDTDKDGSVTQAEFSASSNSRFNKIDTDANDVINADEFKLYIKKRSQERQHHRFVGIDADNNGQLSQDEFLQFKRKKAQHRFSSMDNNNDGLIDESEFSQAKSKHRWGKNKHWRKGKNMFKKLDQNGDGQITRDESRRAWSSWFKRMDANSDQIITMPEVQEHRKKKWQKEQ